jgi:hypothetical protein
LKFIADAIGRVLDIVDVQPTQPLALGGVQLGQCEAVIVLSYLVLQEALRQSVIQLGKILQEIQEGVTQMVNKHERPLESREMKALLARVNGTGT